MGVAMPPFGDGGVGGQHHDEPVQRSEPDLRPWRNSRLAFRVKSPSIHEIQSHRPGCSKATNPESEVSIEARVRLGKVRCKQGYGPADASSFGMQDPRFIEHQWKLAR